MKHYRFFAVILLFISCGDEIQFNDPIEDHPILGTWEINSRSMNGISSLVIECCEFLEFSLDDDRMDQIGLLSYKDPYSEKLGTFNLLAKTDSLSLELDYRTIRGSLKFSESLKVLSFSYKEGDQLIMEDWVKVN